MSKLLKGILVTCICLLIPAFLYAQNAQKVIPTESEAYIYLDHIYRESGLSLASTFRPYTAAEFHQYIAQVNRNLLSREGRRIYTLLEEMLVPGVLLTEGRTRESVGASAGNGDENGESKGVVAFSTDSTVTVEYYRKKEEDSGYFFTRNDRLPIFEFPIELWLFDAFYADATFALQEDHRQSAGRWESITFTQTTDVNRVHENHWNLFSLEVNILELDFYFPFRGLMSIGGSHWHLTYGRDSLNLGNGRSGNLLLSDFPDYYDTLILSTHWDIFKYTANYTYFEPWLTSADKAALASGEYFMRLNDYELPYKALMLHQLELKPLINFTRLPQVTLSVTEAIMFGSQYPQLRDFNPFMIFHNWFEYERSNDSFLFGVNINPIRYVELYYQYFINEFDTSYEEGNNYPGATGWMAGVVASVPLQAGFLTGYLEAVHTDPLLYNRYHPLIAFTSRRRIWSYIAQDQMIYVDKTIGYFTGPDTFLVTGSLSYRLPPSLDAELEYYYIEKGEKDVNSSYSEEPGETTPTGTPEITHVVAGHLSFTPIPMATIGGSVYYLHDTNANHVEGAELDDFQFAIHLTLDVGKQTITQTRKELRN